MAKRRHGHDEELPFVALMDTMTNVVGVLIIVLVMIGISLANSVSKILSELPPVTKEQLQKLIKEVVDKTPKEDPNKVAEETKKLEQDIKKNTEALKSMDLSAEKQNVKLMDLDALRKQLDERKKERDAKKADVEKQLAELDKLKALLDTTPVYTPPPATIVKLPNPRPMPQNAVIQRFLVAGGRINYLNDEEYLKLVTKQIETNLKALTNKEVPVKNAAGAPVMVKDKGGRLVPQTKTILDQKKLNELFTKLRIGTRDLKLEIIPAPTSPRIPFRLTPTSPEAGEDLAQVKNPASVFQRLMRKFKTEPNTVVWFHVYKDSMDLFLNAREVPDALGVPVAWDIYGNPYYSKTIAQFEVDFTPPKAAPPNPNAPPAVAIKPPTATLD
jgi:hypothetical protein